MEEGAICSVIMHARAHTGTQKSNGPLTVSSMLRGSPSMYKFVLDWSLRRSIRALNVSADSFEEEVETEDDDEDAVRLA